MAEGVIKKLVRDRGFGFIKSSEGRKDYFFHIKSVIGGKRFDALTEGEFVRFETRPSRNKPGSTEAYDVQSAGSAAQPSQAPGRPTPPAQTPQSQPETSGLPYGFVRVDVAHAATDSPVWHDGSVREDLYSGEILCGMEILTPTLAGNYRYKKKEADPAKLQAWGFSDIHENKQIAEPLRLPDERVVIAGAALKGMLRQSLGALLSAPMERVAEHHHTYRANLGHASEDKKCLECRPAVVTNVRPDGLDIKVLPAQSAVFIRGKVGGRAVQARNPGDLLTDSLRGARIDKDHRTHQRRLKDDKQTSVTLNHRLYSYNGGIDGTGRLMRAFGGSHKRIHSEALVHADDLKHAVSKTIREEVLRQYELSQRVLADVEAGHLTHAHPLSKKLDEGEWRELSQDIKNAAPFRVDQLIFVEIEVDRNKLGEVQSFGHNYQYRWASSSSVRTVRGKPRACLSPLECERSKSAKDDSVDEPPSQLSGARLLFGYVRNDETNPVGKGVFERMGGRVAINHAVSEGTPRFEGNAAHGYSIPLKILGQPKSSAWEFYLEQPEDRPATYGDTPDDDGGDLNDRKFYLHQPATDLSAICAEGDAITSDQATLARFVCAPKTKFKFAIRFAQLRPWELAALLAGLEPARLAPSDASGPGGYAHKLGLGRPLGMGSVRISCDSLHIRHQAETSLLDEATQVKLVEKGLKGLGDKVSTHVLDAWLYVHRYEDRGRMGYPMRANKPGEDPTIFNWHTWLRRAYCKRRREGGGSWTELENRIKEAKGRSVANY